jgi:prevent-host-death family protein
MSLTVSLHDAKSHISSLVEQAFEGEEIVITKNGVPKAKLVRAPFTGGKRSPANALGLTHIVEDFDAPDPVIEALFTGVVAAG